MPNSDKIIIETLSLGNSLKVSAIDTATGTEVSVICPQNTSELQRQNLAIQKLNYVLGTVNK